MKPYTVTIYKCPNCLADLSMVEIGTRALIKCRDGCSKREIMMASRRISPPPKKKTICDWVGDDAYLAAVKFRRSTGKKVDDDDLKLEEAAWRRVRLGRGRPPMIGGLKG